MRGFAAALASAALGLAVALPAAAAPEADLHELRWFVHTDLIDPDAGLDLAWFEAALDAALAESQLHLEGHQGPADQVCCSRLVKKPHAPGVTIQSFGSSGDGLDVLDGGDLAILRSTGGSGSRAFLIDSILDCGGTPGIGCADLPACGGPPDDDPDLVLVVTMEAVEGGRLGLVIAHERGHHACLSHVFDHPCQLMYGSAGGGCLSAAECDAFSDARTTTGGACGCHEDATADARPDGSLCDGGSGLCSGGACGDPAGNANVTAWLGAGPESGLGAVPDDLLRMSGLTGSWEAVGGSGVVLRGLAYDADAQVLYGVRDAFGDDVLVRLDPASGAVLANLGAVSGHPDLTALAFDPGATAQASDDRLLALSSDGLYEDLIAIDPASAAPTLVGSLSFGVAGSFQGLAYDADHDRLYASGFSTGGLWEIDVASCDPPFAYCAMAELPGVTLPRQESGLAWSRGSGRLLLVGRQAGTRIQMDSIDPVTLVRTPTMGVDGFTTGGMAATPLPEPGGAAAVVAGVALLAGLARRRAALARHAPMRSRLETRGGASTRMPGRASPAAGSGA